MRYRNRHAWREAQGDKQKRRSSDPFQQWRMCGHHQERWRIHERQEDGRIVSVECPKCAKDKEWARKACLELMAEGIETTHEAIVERGEQLAGHQLWRYNHG